MIERALRFHKVLGVVFVALLLLSVWAVYGVFTHKFKTYDEVQLQASSIGLQLPERADVKIRGVIVGEVIQMEATGADSAVLTLGLYPDRTDSIPENVTGAILPKTLFGEKYVELKIPEGTTPTTAPIRAGAVIEHTELATELETVLRDLHPLLRAVEPADLNIMLSAVATALDGRGDALGDNLETLDSYLKRMNPHIPELLEDLRLTAEFSDIYADILPEVATILDNTVTTMQTLEGREATLNQLLVDTRTFSQTMQRFLDDNADLIEELGDLSVRQLRLFRKYSPMFPCLTEGLVGASRLNSEAFRNYQLHIILEFLPNQPRHWNSADRPQLNERRGPDCVTLPNPPFNRDPKNRNWRTEVPNFNDGVAAPTGKGTHRVAPGFSQDTDSYQGSAADVDLLRQLLAAQYGEAMTSDLGVALAAPLVAGGEG
jgi:phospholipid/cholesterol/gamma-HCH transport system substrate-binding protein